MKWKPLTSSGFSIIEVLVGIFIFSLGLVSIYAILAASLSINERNKNTIIASNLAREQIELLRNIRDSNYADIRFWNQFNLSNQPSSGDLTDPNKVFIPWNYYHIENDFLSGGSSVTLLGSSIPQWPTQIADMSWYRLCLNSEKIYTSNCVWAKETPFYRYMYISDKEANEDGLDSSEPLPAGVIRVVSKVVWYKRWYHEFDIQTIITDWRRI